MTVTVNKTTAGPYAGDGVTTAFLVDFPFLDATHLEVYRADVLLTLNTDYTVTGAGQQSGQVILMQPLAVGYTLTIERVVPLTQLADYVQGDAFPAETHEKALDKLTMIAQQLERGLPLPVNLAGLGLVANGSGTLSVKAGNSIEVGADGVAVSRQFRETVTAQGFGIEGLQNETAMIQLRVSDLAASIGEPNSFGNGFSYDAATKTISVKQHTGIAVSADGVAVSQDLLNTIDAKPNAGDVIPITSIATTSDIAAATAGKVVDAAGLKDSRVAFCATGITAQTVPYSDSADTKVTMLTNVEFNHGNGYSAASNQFTAPVAGVYDIKAALYTAGVSGSLVAAPWALLTLFKNGASFKTAYFFQAFRSDGHGLITGNWMVELAQGDVLTLYLRQILISAGVTIRANAATYFAGHLVR